MSAPRRIWVTRTQPQADFTAARLHAMGFEAVVQPVLVVRPCRDVKFDLDRVGALAFTSGHAVRAFAALSSERSLPIFAIGEATAGVARSVGFADVRAAAGDAYALAEFIAATQPLLAQVLNPAAAEPAADLVALLEQRGVRARRVVVYETVWTDQTGIPSGVDTVLIHSPKGARGLAALLSAEQAAQLSLFAISPAAAEPVASLRFARTAISSHPDEESLLRLLEI